jgi:hypothetical protein
MSSVRKYFNRREDFKVQICEGEILENEFYCRLILRQVFPDGKKNKPEKRDGIISEIYLYVVSTMRGISIIYDLPPSR